MAQKATDLGAQSLRSELLATQVQTRTGSVRPEVPHRLVSSGKKCHKGPFQIKNLLEPSYLTCALESDADAVDAYGLNVYSWCDAARLGNLPLVLVRAAGMALGSLYSQR